MPEILVTTSTRQEDREAVMLRERINLPDLESDHFSSQLLERLGWALLDASNAEDRVQRGAQPTG